MPEGGSTYRVPPLGSYPSKQVCMCPYPSVHKSIAKIFNISSFYFNVLIRLPGLFKTKSLAFMFAYLVIFMPVVFHQLFVFLGLVKGHLSNFANSRLILKVLENYLFLSMCQFAYKLSEAQPYLRVSLNLIGIPVRNYSSYM